MSTPALPTKSEEVEYGDLTMLTRVGVVAAPALSIGLLAVGCSLSWSAVPLWTALSWIAGAAAGWCLGTLASPVDGSEATRFAQAGTLLSGVLSGFVVGKLDRLFEAVLTQPPGALSLIFLNTAVFGTNTVLAALLLFMLRSYD